ncbi:MAG: hypothetical protein V4636_05350 [Pseudomonadota bacterium]
MTDPSELAYPKIVSTTTRNDRHGPYVDTHSSGGLTKREHFAAMAMQGLLADRRTMTDLGEVFATVSSHEHGSKEFTAGLRKLISVMSIAHADALIAELNKETP